ncbi:MAG: DoxX family membrane protein [Bacteroidota bacterium]
MKINKQKAWDYFILVARFLLGWTFLRYGFGKLMDGQFGLTEAELHTSVQELSTFKLSWYLFDMQPFKAFIGISQIICGFLLIINRTAILGAFMFLPIVATILIIDITFLKMPGFYTRLGAYILLDLLILYHYKDRMLVIWAAVWQDVQTKFSFPAWRYLILPIMAIILEIALAMPKAIYHLITEPESFQQLYQQIVALF